MGDCFNNPPPSLGQKEILESHTSQNPSVSEHLKVMFARLLSARYERTRS